MEKQVVIQDNFDNIALHAHAISPWDHNVHFHPFLLRQVPENCQIAVDIGCGVGEFARLMSGKAETVCGFDLAPNMIEKAREFSTSYENIIYEVHDIGEYTFQENSIDCFASIAVFHHIDYDDVLPKLKSALRPGGKIIILDLYRQTSFRQLLINNLITLPLSIYHKWKNHVPPLSDEEKIEWQEHVKNDHYGSIDELQGIYDKHLPNNDFRVHLYWRYSMVWTKS